MAYSSNHPNHGWQQSGTGAMLSLALAEVSTDAAYFTFLPYYYLK
jgi:hypothetical protein